MLRNIRLLLILVVSIFVLAACSKAAEIDVTEDNAALDIEQLVNEYSVAEELDVAATVTSNELIVADGDEGEITYELPEDKFFISIAPFEEVTHPCTYHSLDGCQGEMVDEEILVEITDGEGNLIIKETARTMDNGFVDYWLPRNDTYEVKITYEGKVSEEVLSTYDGDRTCITTMHLQHNPEA